MTRAAILVLDSFGIGATADAARFGDTGADTLGRIAARCAAPRAEGGRGRALALPNLTRLGLMDAARASTGALPPGIEPGPDPIGRWGHARELSNGKDTPSGHWEIAGVPVLFEWGYFRERENSFPPALLAELIRRAGLPGVLGNCHASGTDILVALGEEHMRSGKPIVYTSADSVFQIAAHEQTFGLERLLDVSRIARELVDDYNIGRVIARPFVGNDATSFRRTGHRRDFAVPPPAPTLLDRLLQSGGEVIAVGKIADIFAHQGIGREVKADGNAALMQATLDAWDAAGERSLVFTNFVDFDMLFGHRRDALGYAAALEAFDAWLPAFMARLGPQDVMILCADHGCDPGFVGTDHTREHIPVLAWGPAITPRALGERTSFADIGQSLARWFGLAPLDYGRDFLGA
jgi:phosphopentomutase